MAGAGRCSRDGVQYAAPAPEGVTEPRVVIHLRTGLTVRVARASGRARVSVHGEIDIDCADVLYHVLRDCLSCYPDGVDVDLSAVAFFDCAGLNALLRARAQARAAGVRLTVGAVSTTVARVLDLTCGGDAFPEAVVRAGERRRGELLRIDTADLFATG